MSRRVGRCSDAASPFVCFAGLGREGLDPLLPRTQGSINMSTWQSHMIPSRGYLAIGAVLVVELVWVSLIVYLILCI